MAFCGSVCVGLEPLGCVNGEGEKIIASFSALVRMHLATFAGFSRPLPRCRGKRIALCTSMTPSKERCFACGRPLGKSPALVDTRDDQTVYVGRECFKLVQAAGEQGYQPPIGGPKLYPITR